jgi:poly(3-hydroxybutyrate) depolymerase
MSCKFIILSLLIITAPLFGAEVIMKKGERVWTDRSRYLLGELPAGLKFKQAVPRQSCDKREIVFPKGTKRAMIALFKSKASDRIADKAGFKAWGNVMVGRLPYTIYVSDSPPEKLNCTASTAGGILLAINDDVPAPAAPGWKGLAQMQKVAGQEYRFAPGPREVEFYVREPTRGINADTGLMLLLHNWGGTWKMTAPWCDMLADHYNLITVSVNYLQSGEAKHDKVPYDHGLLQAVDCLRAVYSIREQLAKAGVKWNSRRLYAAGGSGGGNVSQMVNKLAPSSFVCIVDICGMPGLTDDIAFGKGRLNAGYSRDPNSPKYLTAAMQEIRNPGNPVHLEIMKKFNPHNKVVIVHGQDDRSCSVVDKIGIFKNMVQAGFRPSGYFLAPSDVDGKVITNTGHGVGDRLQVIVRYAGPFLEEKSAFSAAAGHVDDFEKAVKVEFPCTGGKYVMDFSGLPTLTWQKD